MHADMAAIPFGAFAERDDTLAEFPVEAVDHGGDQFPLLGFAIRLSGGYDNSFDTIGLTIVLTCESPCAMDVEV